MSDCENIWEEQSEQESEYDGPCSEGVDDFISLSGFEWVTLGNLIWVDKS